MKNNQNERYDYSKLKRKVVFQMLVVIVSAIAIVFFFRELVRGYFGNWIVHFFESEFSLSSENAHLAYQYVFRNNIFSIIVIAAVACIVILFSFSLTWITKYFNEIAAGMDQLVKAPTEEIKLSPELESVEKKLNQVRVSLERKTRNAVEAEQRKNDLVVYLAHDIKTPLTSVIGYLNLLNEAPDMPAEQRAKYTGITLEKACRLEDLINEFFEITRFNLETIVLEKSRINLSLMLRQMADEFYPMLVPKGRTAAVHAPEDLILTGDPVKLARVFNNILKNAIAYSYENSAIEICAVQHGGTVVITFSNCGEPIPPQKLDTIFEKFYRLDSARSSNTGGAGLGLAIAKEIVTAHGGTISAESNAEHTVFTVRLPFETVIRNS